MQETWITLPIADLAPVPVMLLGSGAALLIVCGVFLALAVFVAAAIRRRRTRSIDDKYDRDSQDNLKDTDN